MNADVTECIGIRNLYTPRFKKFHYVTINVNITECIFEINIISNR